MEGKIIGIAILYVVGLLLGLISLFMSYIGMPGNYDTEPVLGVGLLLLAIAGLLSLKK